MEFNLADLFENAVDHFGEREYIVADGRRCTYAEMDARANRLAHHLAASGVGPGDHVGIYAYNCIEWIETLEGDAAAITARLLDTRGVRYINDNLEWLKSQAEVIDSL